MAYYADSRNVPHIPPLHIETSPTGRYNAANPFRDSVAGITEMYQVPITPARSLNVQQAGGASPADRSHFSPDTPDMERGLGRGNTLRPYGNISSRIMGSIHRSSKSIPAPSPSPSPNGTADARRTRLQWILGTIVGIVLVVLIANVIYLDIRLMSMDKAKNPSDSNLQAASGPVASSAAFSTNRLAEAATTPTPTVAATPTPRSNSVSLQGIPGLSSAAATCISRFPANAATDVVGFCNTCFTAMQAVPPNTFNPQDPNSRTASQLLANAVLLCSESGFAPA